MKAKTDSTYLKKSIFTFRLYGSFFLFSILVNTLTRDLKHKYQVLFETVVAIPLLLVFILAPIGLYYGWKSYRNKEEPRKKRTIFLMGHMIFCSLIILFIIVLIKDISNAGIITK
ncbi:hypothetical protein FAZ19_07005 [Sphingobacterium alkalisoli]|uniref:Uncharacterized protein n=2 Tax=Sphingobacterium TaxID=28453 RepID=A0A4U0P2I3_9SPHI|nr:MULTISPECIES: hypothetical protein [Sphingobacterium]TJY66659.1 hypothetical protein FAZ19_07005 [Sphingobacterium alkalisoli]TJZ61536.1 hypothetical protein FAZ15_10130 [Sphingobacterium olei]